MDNLPEFISIDELRNNAIKDIITYGIYLPDIETSDISSCMSDCKRYIEYFCDLFLYSDCITLYDYYCIF